MLNLLSAESNLAVIGDDDQSIYAFKHANPEGIRAFDADHPVDSVPAQEALTLLTLLADPDDRVALRAWLVFGSTTERSGFPRDGRR